MRFPSKEDGKGIWELVKSTRVLDLNSAYSYLLLSKYFNETCVVAEADGIIAGFVSAFHPPQQPEVIFVWQVAVDEAFRRHRLGMNMLKHLLARKACSNSRYLEITVNPSNHAAYNLYRKLADELGTSCVEEECFPSRLFPGGQHEEEIMLRIGPLM
ncbi:MAG: diaminobutyrate acetyltransferase [Syntrophomonas sp.]|uniref:diaminobutyrate acetyltransferase n=1 Tax=Syntrophomonas sp. TaxID=2053627 RepID=UPI00262FCF53|nr:diaminobutyrate acetyltransferase [Syntrophomonas sp.]MDD2510751.1 diaminobutyrate acetyltransferase [Syntrophomonas sp.]MDD3879496.1 diaminobutyrate acetyltransferase [Syntrophomonas sp.]MDD4626988.1 diaminobutyrate acetyltransferase [Syntrophomonas sp.]